MSVTVEAISSDIRAVSSELVTSVSYVTYLNFDLMINIWEKKTEMERDRETLD